MPQFQDVYCEYYGFVCRSLRRFGVHPSSIDDAAQDVFVVVHRRLADFEGRSTVRTWLFGIAMRVAREHARKSARRGLQVTLDVELADRNSMSPHEIIQRANAARILERALNSMDETLRIIFVLAELEEFTAVEIGQALDMNPNTVSTRLRKARWELEKALHRMQAHERWTSGELQAAAR